MTKDVALHSFFSGFGLPAYTVSSVPTDAQYPYLTYSPVFGPPGEVVSITANLWYQTESELIPNAKAQEIMAAIGRGVYVEYEGGAMSIYQGSPAWQSLASDKGNNIKQRYMNITIEYN